MIKVSDIVALLEAEVLSGESKLDEEVKSVGASDMISDILALTQPGMMVLTGYTYPQVIRTALVTDLLGLIVVRGKNIAPETIAYARENNFLLLRTRNYLYSSCGMIYATGLRGSDVGK
ncbi:MAG TPA: DRTGG domain-containing protein [Patescibacteria group bacterium]|nr:DRTGG domain-containing protein [Patescibacteria group bacterium]